MHNLRKDVLDAIEKHFTPKEHEHGKRKGETKIGSRYEMSDEERIQVKHALRRYNGQGIDDAIARRMKEEQEYHKRFGVKNERPNG